jgi:hypothetical protein
MPPGRTSRLASSGASSACSHTAGYNRGVAGWLHRRYSSVMWPRDSSTPHVARDQRFAAHTNVCAHPSPSKAKCRGTGLAGGAVWLPQQASTTWKAASNRPRLQSSKQCKAPVRPVVPSHTTIATPTCLTHLLRRKRRHLLLGGKTEAPYPSLEVLGHSCSPHQSVSLVSIHRLSESIEELGCIRQHTACHTQHEAYVS